MKNKLIQHVSCGIIVLLFTSFAAAEITVTITGPADGAVLAPCNDIILKADVQATGGEEIKDVKFYANNKYKGKVKTEPWERTWKKAVSGAYALTAKVTDTNGNEVWSDPIRFKVGLVSSGEKLYNGGFDCGSLLNWDASVDSRGSAKATFTILDDEYFDDPTYLFVDIEAVSDQNWHIGLTQAMKSDSGHVYEISFMADADNIKTITLTMQENQDPWTTQWSEDVVIDGVNEYGPFIFEATKTDPYNVLHVFVGGDDTNCYFDSFSIIDRSATSVKARNISWTGGAVSEFELFQAYPNPFNMNTTIRFKLSDPADIVLDIYNMQGQKVRTLVNGQQPAGEHRAAWNGTNDAGQIVPSGVYLYRLHADGSNAVNLSRKILLLK